MAALNRSLVEVFLCFFEELCLDFVLLTESTLTVLRVEAVLDIEAILAVLLVEVELILLLLLVDDVLVLLVVEAVLVVLLLENGLTIPPAGMMGSLDGSHPGARPCPA